MKESFGNQGSQDQNQQRFPQTKGGPIGGWDDEVTHPRGGFLGDSPTWKLEDSVPGVPGQSYPSYDKVPQTSFDCRKQMSPGYFADVETQCQVFHICQADGRQNSFLCPIGTIFNQQTFVCDWWFNVNCADAQMFTNRNDNLYKSPFIGIDGMKTNAYYTQNQQGQGMAGQGVGRGQGIGGLGRGEGQGGELGREKGLVGGLGLGGGQRIRGGQGGDQGFTGGKGQGRNFQPPAVGIPSSGPQSNGVNWPSQVQGQSQGHPWRQNGNMRGDRSNVNNQGPNIRNRGSTGMVNGHPNINQKGSMAGNPNFRNRSPVNMVNGANRMNQGMNQKGARRSPNSNNDWNQQGSHQRGNEKGRNLPQGQGGNNIVDWSVRGEMVSRNVNNGGQSGTVGGIKGETWNQRRANMQGENFERVDNRRMGRPNQNKGFSANSWSMRPQNFPASVQDRTGSGSDIWSSNINSEEGPAVGNFPSYRKTHQDQNQEYKDQDYNLGQLTNPGAINGWMSENGNVIGENRFPQNDGFGGNQDFGRGHEWKSENRVNKRASLQTNNQYRNHEVDYDYE